MRDEKLRVDPDSVSSTSTVTPIFGDQKTNTPIKEANDVDMLAGLTSDLVSPNDPKLECTVLSFQIEDSERYIPFARCPEGGVLYWYGGSRSIRCHYSFHFIPCLGAQIFIITWIGIHGE